MSVAGKIVGTVITLSCGAFIVSGIVSANTITAETEVVDEAIPFSTETQYDNTLREGTEKVVQEGKDGKKKVTYTITNKGGKFFKKTIKSQDIIEAPASKKIVVGTKKYYTCSNGTEYDSIEAKNECENRISWETEKNKSLQEFNADPEKFNCWYDAYPGTTLHWSYYVRNSSPQYRSGAVCRDGWVSSATGRGACSHHGGVSYWF